jgi:hypothetical protein
MIPSLLDEVFPLIQDDILKLLAEKPTLLGQARPPNGRRANAMLMAAEEQCGINPVTGTRAMERRECQSAPSSLLGGFAEWPLLAQSGRTAEAPIYTIRVRSFILNAAPLFQ